VIHFGQLCPVDGTVQHKQPDPSQREDDRTTPNECLVLSEQL